MTFISSTKLAVLPNDRTGARLRSTVQEWSARKTLELLPGLFLNLVAFAIRLLPGMATFSPTMLSLTIGIVLHNIAGTAAWAKQGVTLRVRWLLRIATNTVTDALDEEAACAIACVTVFGSFVMFADPIAADAKAWIVAAATFLSIALAAMSLETNIGTLTRRAFGPLCSMDSPSRSSRD